MHVVEGGWVGIVNSIALFRESLHLCSIHELVFVVFKAQRLAQVSAWTIQRVTIAMIIAYHSPIVHA